MKENDSKGMLYATFAYIIWGLFPLYWKSVGSFPPLFLLTFRITMSFIVVFFVVITTKNIRGLFISKRHLFLMLLAGLLLGSNWYLFIYAVANDRILDSSLAYYMTPIMSMAIGILLLRERKTKLEYMAIVFAIVGVAYRTYTFGSLPLLSIAMGGSFALYGFIKKQTRYNSIQSAALEMMFLLIPSLIYIYQNMPPTFETRSIDWILLAMSGIVTMAPLFLFGVATKILKMSTLAFFQFITPIISAILGIFLYKEPFTKEVAITFLLIMIGVIFYIISIILKNRNMNKLESK